MLSMAFRPKIRLYLLLTIGLLVLSSLVLTSGHASTPPPGAKTAPALAAQPHAVVAQPVAPSSCVTPTFGLATNYAVGSGPNAVIVADFNGDGYPDLAVSNISSA